MLIRKLSTYDGTLDIDDLIEIINTTSKPITHTDGFRWRNPTIHNLPITKEEAIDMINHSSILTLFEYDDKININTYTCEDFW